MAMDILGSSGEMIATLLSNGSSTVVWHYSWGVMTKCLPIQDTDLITYKVWISSKIQFSEPMSFTEITYKSKIGLKMTISPKSTPAWVTDYESSRPGAHWSIRGQLNRWENVLQGSSVRAKLFPVTKLSTDFLTWLGSCLLFLSGLDNLFLLGGLAGMSFF